MCSAISAVNLRNFARATAKIPRISIGETDEIFVDINLEAESDNKNNIVADDDEDDNDVVAPFADTTRTD